MKEISFCQEVPVKYDVDIAVIGGGPSGTAAGIVAARTNKRVLILEEQNALGGAGTIGMVPMFMQFGDGQRCLAAGIGEEIYERLKQAGGAGVYNKSAIQSEIFKRVYEELALEAGVSFLFGTKMIGVSKQESNVTYVIFSGRGGIFAVAAKRFIDCTGDGSLCALAGVPFEMGNENGELMPGTLCSYWTDIDWEQAKTVNKCPQSSFLSQAFSDNMFDVEDLHLTGITRNGPSAGGGNVGHAFGFDPFCDESATEGMIEQRKRLLQYQAYYRKYIAGFSKVELAYTAPVMGVRESRRILGDYVLNLQDFKSRAVFEDEIGRYCYPIDIHPSSPDKEGFAKFEMEFTSEFRYGIGESYGIPYRCLTPKGLDNTLTAGRCISTDRYLMASVRTIPGCYITGQAAGMAAAISLDENVSTRGINVKFLQKRLKDAGAYLPNYNI